MIPVSEPLLSNKELEYATQCIASGWISSAGHFIEDFEHAWAAYCGMHHGVAVGSGTAALQIAVAALDLQPGDEIIMPSFTIISCALAAVYNGAVPVLVDCDPATWCMDPDQVNDKITARTRIIMPVHMYGHPADMDPLLTIAEEHGLTVIEDAAQAHGAEYLCGRGSTSAVWRRCGGIAHISTFSFYANKLITTGEGGMILTNDAGTADRARGLRNLCFRPERRFLHTELGYNYRLTNVQAAIGLAQVERMEQIVARKREIGVSYTERLADIGALQLPVEETWAKHVYWMYGLVLNDEAGCDAEGLAAVLKSRGIETRPFFLGLHEQPALQKRGLFRGERYPVTERIARQGLYVPSGVALTDNQIGRVCEQVRRILV